MSFPYRLIDLTHTLNANTPSWNGGCGFHQKVQLDYAQESNELSFRVQQLKMHAGIGTHLDAPAHCNRGSLTMEELPLTDLVVPCVMIDVSSQTHAEYRFSLDDLKCFEEKQGLIEPGSFVIIRTGWDQFWKEPDRYRNNHLFPSISKEAALFLLERQIVGLGIDTLSPDKPCDGYPVHEILLGANKYIVENVAHADQLPSKGSYSVALPIKTEGGTEAPMRLIAFV